MPYIYDMPSRGHGHEYHARDRQSLESDQDYADVELLKLLNGGGYQKSVEPQMRNGAFSKPYGYTERVEEEEEYDVSVEYQGGIESVSCPDMLTMSPFDQSSLSINFSPSNETMATPFGDPPFIVDLSHLQQSRSADIYAQQGDFMVNKRYPRMSFDGRPYPPVPPEASTLARPLDDWSQEDTIPFNSQHKMQAPQQTAAYQLDRYSGEPAQSVHQGSNNVFAFDSAPFVEPHQQMGYAQQQAPAWTPPHGDGWFNPFPGNFHAPVLHPRLIHLPEQPITPHDTYRYPASHVDQIYVAPVVPEVSAADISAAFATWYANQVISLLVTPGSFRPGVGGASDETWGPAGVERESWLRQGRTPPDFSKSWGRMGMTATPEQAPRKVSFSRRRPEVELRDPYNVAWVHSIKPSSSFVSFILDMIQRMTISPVALVSAVWFLHGLGFHDGDGHKGTELRAFLQKYQSYEAESIERRVATLGLMLAGKWLDDNSFLTKSWCEVTTIPVKQLDQMERIALADLNFSLHVPVSSWVDHVNKLYTALITKILPDEDDVVVTPVIDEMVTEARNVELEDPQSASPTMPHYERRASSDELPAAADQAISRDWGTFARTYGISLQEARDLEVDVEMERAERDVNALLNDDYMEDNEDDEDEEFLDYDGAKKWLPSLSELKRSGSNSSDTSLSSYDSLKFANRQGHPQTSTQPLNVPAEFLDTPPRQRSYSDWTQTSTQSDHSFDWEPSNDFLYPVHPTRTESGGCRKCKDCQDNYGSHKSNAYESAGFVEPGINIVQPPRYETRSFSKHASQKKYPFNHGNHGNGNGHGNANVKDGYPVSASASKRWGQPIGAVKW
ncbi:uncharacterized protein I303_104237 [Kwoniella dejecticola CBS 10117]|uniref:Cyclin N-terminal domain-containing protein n=1 Tax=Kwoniella dejecticola CBS 10117 TaxID=1296121 RepID=A0A1A6A5W5_9TREE|nr:uncharacterized protein I303_04786 [Kwoniella dejecticola CBS 10117]OBR85450.1 hypothetical protein I303_04786 [Kwoniella dejecticola CBS 10117]